MPVVQQVSKSTQASTLTISSSDGWTTPSASNIVIAVINSDDTFTMSGTPTRRGTNYVADQQANVWDYGSAPPPSVAGTQGGGASAPVSMTLIELSTAGFDVVGAYSSNATGATSATAPSVTTTAAN